MTFSGTRRAAAIATSPQPLTLDDAVLDWTIIDTTSWDVVQPESRGVRAKMWVVDSAEQMWLRKTPKPRGDDPRLHEAAIELFALQLAREVGVRSADARLTTWSDETGFHQGILVAKFLAADESLSHAAEILKADDGRYDVDDHRLHTVERSIRALSRLENEHAGTLIESFAHLLIFDAWIGNADRHQENWGVVIRPSGERLFAPMYDPAASLGGELLASHILFREPIAARVDKYVDGCRSGFGDGATPKILLDQRDVIQSLLRARDWTD